MDGGISTAGTQSEALAYYVAEETGVREKETVCLR